MRYPLRGFDDTGEQRRRSPQFAVEQLRAVLLAYHWQVREAGRYHQRYFGAGVFEQGVGGHGGAKPNFRDGVTGRPMALQEAVHPLTGGVHVLLRVHGQQLVRMPVARRRDRDDIGEGAAAVNPEAPTWLAGVAVWRCWFGDWRVHDAREFNGSAPAAKWGPWLASHSQ